MVGILSLLESVRLVFTRHQVGLLSVAVASGPSGRLPLVLDILADTKGLEPVKRRAAESDKRFGELDLCAEIEKDESCEPTDKAEPGEVFRP